MAYNVLSILLAVLIGMSISILSTYTILYVDWNTGMKRRTVWVLGIRVSDHICPPTSFELIPTHNADDIISDVQVNGDVKWRKALIFWIFSQRSPSTESDNILSHMGRIAFVYEKISEEEGTIFKKQYLDVLNSEGYSAADVLFHSKWEKYLETYYHEGVRK